MKLTPTQQRIMDVLKDGQLHQHTELEGCVSEETSAATTLKVHLTYLRRVIRPHAQDVVCRIENGVTFYHLIRLTASPYTGRN